MQFDFVFLEQVLGGEVGVEEIQQIHSEPVLGQVEHLIAVKELRTMQAACHHCLHVVRGLLQAQAGIINIDVNFLIVQGLNIRRGPIDSDGVDHHRIVLALFDLLGKADQSEDNQSQSHLLIEE